LDAQHSRRALQSQDRLLVMTPTMLSNEEKDMVQKQCKSMTANPRVANVKVVNHFCP
jgi:hypothetical protein